MYHLNEQFLTANPFNSPSGGDFRLNNDASGGALLNNAGIMRSPLGSTFETDIGAATEPVASGGGGTVFFLPPRLIGG